MRSRTSRLLALAGSTAVLAAAIAAPASAGRPPRPQPSSAPKNVIVFVGDGMGPAQVNLGRTMNGGSLFIDQIPWGAKGSLDTTSLEGTTDSAAGATALASGAETNNGWVGMVPTSGGGGQAVETVLERAEDRGKATGLISDSYITDATPAAFAAHVTSRSETEAIAGQMADQGMEFLMGGGLRQGSVAPLLGLPGHTYVDTADELDAYVAGGGAGPVFGFFGSWNMAFNLDRDDEGVATTDPTLPEMTAAALSTLSKDPDGFFLMVEAGLIDWAGHEGDAASMGDEMIEMDDAVQVAYEWAASRSDTSIIFTADHETGGFAPTRRTNYTALKAQTATLEYMWGRISKGDSIRSTLTTYANIVPTAGEIATVTACGEHGIRDVLAARWKVTWGESCTDEGEHTDTFVPAWAWGPRAGDFAGIGYDNERVGLNLLSYFAA
ncbi:MAG: alkaline phosphatase [Actinomycetota bacterium]